MNSTIPFLITNIDTDGDSLYLQSLSLIAKHNKNVDVSPVTLSGEWSKMARILLLSCLSVIGSIGNVFMISSVMIEDHLKKAGNAFVVNIALADLLITSVLIPASIIVLLSGVDDSSFAVCRFQWFLAACAFLVSVFSLAVTAIENYVRLCTSQDNPPWFSKTKTTTILLLIWFVGSISSGLQWAFNLSFDYCSRSSNGIIPYQAAILALCILLPLIITFYMHMRILIDVKRYMKAPNYKPSLAYTWDLQLTRTNFYSYLIFVIFWIPFGIVLAYASSTTLSNRVFYNTAWFGFSKSCFHNVIYCLTNRHFRNAYVNLFHYCCCKTTVSTARRQRPEAGTTRPTADVRVHIIPGYNMYSYTSPQRSGNCHGYWNKRDVHEL